MRGYGEDLAAIHAAGFTDVARAAAEELIGRLPAPGARDRPRLRRRDVSGRADRRRSRGARHRRFAGPDRAGAAHGAGWAVLAESRPRPDAIKRRIVTFRTGRDGRCRRSEELHRVLLHRPEDVLARLAAAGLEPRILPGGYAGVPLPEGLTVFLARRR